MNKIKKLMVFLINDLPNHKLIYIIRNKEYVTGIWGCLHAYGLAYSKENHEVLIDVVQDKLEGCDIEREWSEDEYNNFVLYSEVDK